MTLKKMGPVLFFVLLFVFVAVSCSQQSLSTETSKETVTEEKKTVETEVISTENREEEMTEETVTEEKKAELQGTETSVSMQESSLYKTYGRTYVTENGLNVDFGGNGMEFEVVCSGNVWMRYRCAVATYFQVFVDGNEGLRVCTQVGTDLAVMIASNLEEGPHNIRVIRDTDATKKGEVMAISEILFEGDKSSFKATAEKDLYIEFVGDSITAGKYTEMKYIEGDAIHKATNSYAYLTAQALNADYSMLARGGCGYFRVSTCPRTMNQLYPYYNGFAKEPVAYKPSRCADVVILALGTNDSEKNVTESYQNGTVPFATFEEALTDQIRQIRDMHGKDVPVVLLYGMMSTSWEAQFKAVSQTENTYLLKVTKNRLGGNNHPSTEGHQVFAKELTEFLKAEVLK